MPHEPLRHLGARSQVRAGMRRQPAVELVEPAVRAHGGDRRGEQLPLRHGVVHVVRREERQAALAREPGEHLVVARVERVAVVDELDVDGVPPEQPHEPVELARRGIAPLGGERPAHGALAASGQDGEVPVRLRGELVEVVDRPPLLGPLQLRVRDGAGEPVIALLAPGEHEQVRADRVGLAVLRLRQLERELGAEHGLQLQRLGGLGEAHDAVEAVVVGDREGVQAEPLRLFGHLFGRGRPVEERERRVRVQLGVRDRPRPGARSSARHRVRACATTPGCRRRRRPRADRPAGGGRSAPARSRTTAPRGCRSPSADPPSLEGSARFVSFARAQRPDASSRRASRSDGRNDRGTSVSHSSPPPSTRRPRRPAARRCRRRRRPGTGARDARARHPTPARRSATGPAHASIARRRPPSASIAGTADTFPRSSTSTSSPPSAVTSTGIGSANTVAGSGSGRLPGHGRARSAASPPRPRAFRSRASRSPHGTSTCRSASHRPPPIAGVTTPRCPSIACTRERA